MPAHRLVSDQQLDLLVPFMESHRDFACGRVTNGDGAQAKQIARERWERLAERLNAVGVGVTKTAMKWREELVDIMVKRMDMDLDGVINLKDFHESVVKTPQLLESLGYCLPERPAVYAFLATWCPKWGKM